MFGDAPGVLIITRVALECWDTVGLAHLCRDALANEHTYQCDKKGHEKVY
jgi:hypothetical protein